MSNSRRSSLGGGSTQEQLRPRVIECINRLADRDTLAIAAAELDGIAKNLTEDLFSSFITCLHNTDNSTRVPVRKHCVRILSVLSESHGDSLSPHVSKMLSTILRRIRDPETAVRSACVEAVAAMSSKITVPSFSTAFLKPLIEAMATEQKTGAQIGAAMCLSAAIDSAPKPDAFQLRQSLSRLGKLARSDGFKAKAAVLSLIGSVIGVGGASSAAILDWLVPSVVEFLSGEDWSARKAAAEVLGRVAVAERDLAERYRDSCLTALESRRFDKVKVVRETMKNTLELWKDVSSATSEGFSSPTQSRSSTSTDNGIGRCFPPLSKSSQDSSFKTPRMKKSPVSTNRSPHSDSDGSSLRNSVKKGSFLRNSPTSVSSSKPDLPKKKPASNCKVEISVPGSKVPREEHFPFRKTSNERGYRFGGSRVFPFLDDEYDDEKQGLVVEDCDAAAEEAFESQKDVEGLCLIREQLLQIENQQSSLLDLLQRFIGSSQNGLSSLETRVNGIETALEEMSYSMAISSGRITDDNDNTCCKLPSADFLSSKFWRRADFTERFPSPLNRDCGSEAYKLETRRFRHRSSGAFVPSNRLRKDTARDSNANNGFDGAY